MAGSNGVYCSGCGKMHVSTQLSRRGLCHKCSRARIREARDQIVNKQGPVYDRYSTGMTAAIKRRRQES